MIRPESMEKKFSANAEKKSANDSELDEMIKLINSNPKCLAPVNRAVIPIYENWDGVVDALTTCGYRVTVESFESDNNTEHFRDMILTWEDK